MAVMNTKITVHNLEGNIDEIIRKVTANIHLAANPAEACPAQQEKVEDLSRSPPATMVGKVAEASKK
jgi:alkyl hydroperoxide reductase subunit AhpC